MIPIVDESLGPGTRQCAYSHSIYGICSDEVYKLKIVYKRGEIRLQSNPSYSNGYIVVPSLRKVLGFRAQNGEVWRSRETSSVAPVQYSFATFHLHIQATVTTGTDDGYESGVSNSFSVGFRVTNNGTHFS